MIRSMTSTFPHSLSPLKKPINAPNSPPTAVVVFKLVMLHFPCSSIVNEIGPSFLCEIVKWNSEYINDFAMRLCWHGHFIMWDVSSASSRMLHSKWEGHQSFSSMLLASPSCFWIQHSLTLRKWQVWVPPQDKKIRYGYVFLTRSSSKKGDTVIVLGKDHVQTCKEMIAWTSEL